VRILQVACAFSTVLGSIGWAGPLASDARSAISGRMASSRTGFQVYVDGDSAFNHGYPSGKFGSPSALDGLELDPSCVEDTASTTTGCSISADKLDRVRGTVFRIKFPALPRGQYAGLNIEEPEGWGSQARPRSGNGFDLSRATQVSFDVRTPSAAFNVQFSVGDCVAPYVTVPKTWTRITLDLKSLSCRPNLAQVNLLFGIASNDLNAPQGGTVLLDNIAFNAEPTAQMSLPFFPISTQTFGVVPRSTPADGATAINGKPQFPHDQVLLNLSTTYESALVGIVAARRGTPQGIAEARAIADALSYALHHPNRGMALTTTAAGEAGLQNGYMAGDLPLFNAQGPLPQAQQGDVRLAGFMLPNNYAMCGTGRFCLLLDGATGGNNAFGIMALVAAYGATGDVHYLNDARIIGNWVTGKLLDSSTLRFGGYYLGYPDGGQVNKTLITGKSTENNADIFHAFTLLAGLVIDRAEAQEWQRRANIAGDFALAMFDATSGCFHAGTVPAGTPAGLGITANGAARGGEVINTYPFLDSNSFTVLPMAASARYRNAIDWRRPVQCIADRFGKQVTAGDNTFSGMSITGDALGGPQGIAWEFTGQAIVAMRLVDRLYGEQRFSALADRLNGEVRRAQQLAPFGDGKGLVASTLQAGDTLAPIDQCLITPFQCIPERVGLAATAWAVLADEDLNPFAIAPAVRFSSSVLDFGTVARANGSQRLALVVSNQGNLPAIVLPTLATIRSSGEFAIGEENCSAAALAPAGQCTVQVDFTPQTVGPRSGQLTVSFGAGDTAPLSVPLVAQVTAPNVRFDTEAINVEIGKPFRLTVLVPEAPADSTLLARAGQVTLARCALVAGRCTLDLTLPDPGSQTLQFDYSIDGTTTLGSVAKVVNVKMSPGALADLILYLRDP
jgi:hypothetical protein